VKCADPLCGRDFDATNRRGPRPRYCSSACRQRVLRERNYERYRGYERAYRERKRAAAAK
jgi:hypothetical protein